MKLCQLEPPHVVELVNSLSKPVVVPVLAVNDGTGSRPPVVAQVTIAYLGMSLQCCFSRVLVGLVLLNIPSPPHPISPSLPAWCVSEACSAARLVRLPASH